MLWYEKRNSNQLYDRKEFINSNYAWEFLNENPSNHEEEKKKHLKSFSIMQYLS